MENMSENDVHYQFVVDNESSNEETCPEVSTCNMQRCLWTKENTRLMLELYRDKSEQVANGTIRNRSTMWHLISKDMQAHGYTLTSAQVENKFKKLTLITKNLEEFTQTNGKINLDQATLDILQKIWRGKHQNDKKSESGVVKKPRLKRNTQKTTNEDDEDQNDGAVEDYNNAVLQRVSEAISNSTENREQCLDVLQQIQANQEYMIEQTVSYRERTEVYREKKLKLMERLIRALEK